MSSTAPSPSRSTPPTPSSAGSTETIRCSAAAIADFDAAEIGATFDTLRA